MTDISAAHDATLREAIMSLAKAFDLEITRSIKVSHLVAGVMGLPSRRAFIDAYKDQPLISLHQRFVLAAFLELLGERGGGAAMRAFAAVVRDDVVHRTATHWADAYARLEGHPREERLSLADAECLAEMELVPVSALPEADAATVARAVTRVRPIHDQALAGVRRRWDEVLDPARRRPSP